MKLIANAHILTMQDEEFENGYIIIDDGKIHSVGDVSALPME